MTQVTRSRLTTPAVRNAHGTNDLVNRVSEPHTKNEISTMGVMKRTRMHAYMRPYSLPKYGLLKMVNRVMQWLKKST